MPTFSPSALNFSVLQSGQSLIEHSYRLDSDLSPAGWEYAETLKSFIVDRRKKSIEQRKAMGLPVDDNNKLVVRISFIDLFSDISIDASVTPGIFDRYGRRPAVGLITPPGLSSKRGIESSRSP